jgi:glutaredoxin
MKKAVEGVLRRGKTLAYAAISSETGNFLPPVRYARRAAGFVNDLLGRPLASSDELERRQAEEESLQALAEKARAGYVAPAKKEAAPVMLYVTDQFVRERKRLEDVLKGRSIPYQVLDVTDDEATRSWALTKAHATEFPLLFVAGESVGGFESVLSLDASGGLTKKVFG